MGSQRYEFSLAYARTRTTLEFYVFCCHICHRVTEIAVCLHSFLCLLENVLCFLEKVPCLLENVPCLLENVPCFPKKVPCFVSYVFGMRQVSAVAPKKHRFFGVGKVQKRVLY